MAPTAEVRERIREVIQDVARSEPEIIDLAVERIMDVVDPFRKAAFEEMDRFRATFTELAE
jgi:hypothetical protein